MQCVTRPRITELNPHLLCVLCGGYYIDATAIIECLHSFCKSCIVRYLETHKYCPICDVLVHKTHPLQNIRPDKILQSIVYKLVPNLYEKEMCNRRNFYAQVHPNVQPADPELKGEITESSCFFSFSETISLSLEYINYLGDQNYFFVASSSKRYFRCQANVSIKHLRKLIAAKYALHTKHEIRFFFNGIQLPEHLTLLDIAYISSWKRRDSIRLLYQILEVRKTAVPEKEKIASTPERIVRVENLKTNALCALSTDTASEDLNIVPKQTREVPNLISLKVEPRSQSSTRVETSEPTSKSSTIEIPSTSSSVTVTSSISAVNTTPVSSVSAPIVTSVCKPTVNGTVPDFVGVPETITHKPVVTNGLITLEVEIDESIRSKDIKVNKSVVVTPIDSPCESVVLKRPLKSVADKVEPSEAIKSSDSPVPAKVPKLSNNEDTEPPKTVYNTSPKPPVFNSVSTAKSTTAVSSAITLTYSLASKYNSVKTNASTVSKSEQVQKIGPRPIFSRAEPPSITKSTTKIMKAITRPWNSPSASSSSMASTSAPSIEVKEKPKAMKMINARNTPRYLGNPASGIRPMYSIPAPVMPNKPSKDEVKKPAKNVSVMKIDPQTLSPIVASTSSSPMSTSPSVSKKTFSFLPSASDLYSNAYTSNSLPAHTTSSMSSKSPYMMPPNLTHSALHPMNQLMYEMYGNRPRTLEYMKAMSNFCNPSLFHPSMPAPINTLYSSLHSPAKYEKSHSKMSTKSPPPAVQRIPPTNNNTKMSASEHSTDRKATASAGKHDTISNGQIKRGRKPSEVSNFSINNLIPIEAMKHVSHACSADGVNQICDQLPPDPSKKIGNGETKVSEKTPSKDSGTAGKKEK